MYNDCSILCVILPCGSIYITFNPEHVADHLHIKGHGSIICRYNRMVLLGYNIEEPFISSASELLSVSFMSCVLFSPQNPLISCHLTLSLCPFEFVLLSFCFDLTSCSLTLSSIVLSCPLLYSCPLKSPLLLISSVIITF